jgi:hypothetical protein
MLEKCLPDPEVVPPDSIDRMAWKVQSRVLMIPEALFAGTRPIVGMTMAFNARPFSNPRGSLQTLQCSITDSGGLS